MKKKLILLVMSAVLILSGCNGGASEKETENTTTASTSISITTTTADGTDDPQMTTTAPVTEDQPSVPETTPPATEEIPGTSDLPQTDELPLTEESPGLDKGSEQELDALLKKYPIVSAPEGAFASQTLVELIESASGSFSESQKQSIKAEGTFATSVPLLGEISHQELLLALLTDGTDYHLTSKIIEKNKVIDDSQVYQNGWLYNTSTTTENGKVSETDHYKIKMSPEAFGENVLASTQITMDTVRDLAELLGKAQHIKAGMLVDGSLAIVAKGYDFADMIHEIDPDGNMAEYIDINSFSEMETALLIDAAGVLTELYVKLPLGIKLEGIPMTMTIELTVTPSVPETVEITVPVGGEDYIERTIDEVYGDEDDFVFDW